MRPPQRFPSAKPRSSQKVLLALGVVIVGVVAALLFGVIPSGAPGGAVPVAATPTPPRIEMVECLIATEKIEAGSPLDPSRFRKESRPVVSGSARVISSYDKLRGAYAASFIAAGQPLLVDYVTMKAPINQIQANIPEGYRAVAVAVDDVSNVEGWVRAGAKVDVMFVSQVNNKPVIALLVQNAKVLSTGKITGAAATSESATQAGRATTITIMVTIEEAAKIQLASSSGKMSLALRGDEDTVESAESHTITLDSVLGLSGPTPLPGPAREGRLKIGDRTFYIVEGKLIPEEEIGASAMRKKPQ